MDIQDDIARIEKKLDRLLKIFEPSDQPRRSKKQLDEVAEKSVVDFLRRRDAKSKNGNQAD